MTVSKPLALAFLLCVSAVGVVWYFVATQNNIPDNDRRQSITSPESKKPSGAVDERPYSELMGDEFDEAYLASMLAHHEGAVNMAEQAQAATSREEIRLLAGNITANQSREMAQMRQWQQDWGYDVTNSAGHMSHGGAGSHMAGDMMEMQNSLIGLSGEAFDKEFLKQMITHHQQAIDMSVHASTNAKHQNLKDLAKDIISDQTGEIEQMRLWQREWGF